jgi:Tfp pilus assembly protein PilN
VRYSNILDEIAMLLPNNMWVSTVSIDPSKKTVALAGFAAEQPGVRPLESIAGFMKSVNKSQVFTSATISSTSRGNQTVGKVSYVGFTWTIDMTYDEKAAVGNVGNNAEASPEKKPAKGNSTPDNHGRS